MRSLHLPGVLYGAEPPFRFPDNPACPSDLQYTAADYPEPPVHGPDSSTPSQHVYLIRVLTTALTRGELTWQEILEPSRFQPYGGAIPGHDVVGIVDRVLISPNAQSEPKFSPGDRVWALLDFDRDGAAATYTLALEKELSLAPSNPDSSAISEEAWVEQMATLPLSALTAYQALYTHGRLPLPSTDSPLPLSSSAPRKRVLILGSAGSVGLPTLQLAKASGFSVIATCSSASAPLITPLIDVSTDTIIDYTSEAYTSLPSSFASRSLPPVDVVVDCIGGSTLSTLLLTDTPALNTIINPGGRVITIVAPIKVYGAETAAQIHQNCARAGVEEVEFFVVKPSGEELDVLARWVTAGKLKGHVHQQQAFGLENGREAMEFAEARGRKGGGKVVLRVATQ
ncbi:uncharacterized protein Z519_05588 [Cladophialophora bantiana CBS 173.52]|uniref:Enoyl reductase (ER) domain-containing protein n=1 Tax=Cladophialophora bantiana (strain ATCC 10958 / CBS 173.52 / CDC B-1940 / NIH 8579) TaxID=1442370 RepID=A0A0D2G6N4_CLAB1|nr:uncharacterized protein Z519_05588 [Cladophialophora bantiana CBS 173.52]KIW94272.1 hypothetical protein Z519_05588 [Cladophialophora bantiana CBS 173.52]